VSVVVHNVVSQHVSEVSDLWSQRVVLCGSPRVKLRHLGRWDERIAAHLDGVAIAGPEAEPCLAASLESVTPGNLFAATVVALQARNLDRLQELIALAEAVPQACSGLNDAFGWVEPDNLRGLVPRLLQSAVPFQRRLGIAASARHRVDPGIAAGRRIEDGDPSVRARALRTAGELGLHQMVSSLAAAVDDDDSDCRFWAAWAAVLLGDREQALGFLAQLAGASGELPAARQAMAFQLALQAMRPKAGHDLIRRIAEGPESGRYKIRGAGLIGDPVYVPWLIGQMGNDATARLAGEAFSLITGANLVSLRLERKASDTVGAGPNDDPEDSNVDMDADEGLPWPDPQRVGDWWAAHEGHFAAGERSFMGSPVTPELCIKVLRYGFQRQRQVAALHLALTRRGSVLFEHRAPVTRQIRWLAETA
jgi:uncharacterized protein (TIGR02270 family)